MAPAMLIPFLFQHSTSHYSKKVKLGKIRTRTAQDSYC